MTHTALGVLGEQGGGCLQMLGLGSTQIPILMGTLGKALGTAGAFVAGSDDFIEYLIQKARTYIYTTAMPPAIAEATRTSLKLTRTEHWRREQLEQHIAHFRQGAIEIGLQLCDSSTPIQPILIGDSRRAVEVSDQLLQQGILLSAIRPPTVPKHSARLRVTLSAAHNSAQINQLLQALERII